MCLIHTYNPKDTYALTTYQIPPRLNNCLSSSNKQVVSISVCNSTQFFYSRQTKSKTKDKSKLNPKMGVFLKETLDWSNKLQGRS